MRARHAVDFIAGFEFALVGVDLCDDAGEVVSHGCWRVGVEFCPSEAVAYDGCCFDLDYQLTGLGGSRFCNFCDLDC